MQARKPALLALALSLSIVACSNDNDDVSLGNPILTGTVMTTPLLDGAWLVTSTPAVSGCGALNVLFATQSVLTITQAGNEVEFSLTDGCGRPIPGGEGRVDAARIVELDSEADKSLTATCTLKLDQVRLGSVETPPNEFSGTDVLTISGSDVLGVDDCDPALPCSVTGTFTATRCPRSGCAVTCAP